MIDWKEGRGEISLEIYLGLNLDPTISCSIGRICSGPLLSREAQRGP